MFGDKAKQQELETQVLELREQLSAEQKARRDLEQQLKSARETIAGLEKEKAENDRENLREKSRETIAEYEELKNLYNGKVQEFEASRNEKEEALARDVALKRFHLEEEVQEARKENQERITAAVKGVGESYNYYLEQIRILLNALGNVASTAGKTMFVEPADDLKVQFDRMLAEELKSGKDALRGKSGNLIVIGSAEEAEKEAEQEKQEEACPAPEGCAETAPEEGTPGGFAEAEA